EGEGDVGGGAGLTLIKIRLFKEAKKDESGHGHSEAFGVITRVVFPDVSLPHLAKVHAPDAIESSSLPPSASSDPSTSSSAGSGQQQQPLVPVGSGSGGTSAMDAEKAKAAAEAELLDTLVGLVALKGGTGGVAPNGGGGLGAEAGSLGNGRYAVKLSEGRESSGKVDQSTLLNLLFVPDGSPMKVLAKALLRLDGLSHVLAWTRDPVLACKDPASLDFVELPRLRLRFEAKADGPGGKVRLHSLEHAGMFISGADGAEMTKLVEGLPSSLLLENSEKDRFLLLPSATLPGRPESKGTPFSGEVVLNRCDSWWLRCVGDGARHHLYPVHVSGCLLSTPSLSAALYLLVSRFVAGQYEQVWRRGNEVASSI
ncbi:unnamed protein product, partial [Ectocarpus sp. 8 AP-2014]